MIASRKRPEELKNRATGLYLDALKDPDRVEGLFAGRVGKALDVNPQGLLRMGVSSRSRRRKASGSEAERSGADPSARG